MSREALQIFMYVVSPKKVSGTVKMVVKFWNNFANIFQKVLKAKFFLQKCIFTSRTL